MMNAQNYNELNYRRKCQWKSCDKAKKEVILGKSAAWGQGSSSCYSRLDPRRSRLNPLGSRLDPLVQKVQEISKVRRKRDVRGIFLQDSIL